MMESTVNTFIKGLNRDVSPLKYSNESYFDALNVKIITDLGLSNFSITNEKGNTNVFNVPTVNAVYELTINEGSTLPINVTINGQYANFNVPPSGWTYDLLEYKLKDRFAYYIARGDYKVFNQLDRVIVVGLDAELSITSANASVLIPKFTISQIVGSAQMRDYLLLFTVGSMGELSSYTSNGQIWKLKINEDGTIEDIGTSNYLVPSKHLVYNNLLNFSIEYRIEAYTNYETSEVGKVYFTDNNNNFRHFNVLADDTLGIPLSTLELTPDIQFGTIDIDSVTNTGELKSGMIQYAYQYYNLHGSQTVFSPTSGLIHLTQKSESLSDTRRYFGSPTDTNTGKAVKFIISGLDRRFTNVRVVSLFYKTLSSTPVINIIEDRNIPKDGIITVVDTGNISKGELSDIEFSALGSINFKCKTLDVKDNILFAANIEEEFYDVDEEGYWDSRAYRFDTNGNCAIKDINNSTLPISNYDNVPQEHDCIQSKTEQYLKYKFTKTHQRLGGEGKNIKYYFDVESLIEDDSSLTDPKSYYAKGTSSGYTNYANPLIQATKLGYMRDEVYRFGIVFIDERGRKSFVKWIADIKMPSIGDVDTTVHSDGEYGFKTFYLKSSGIHVNPLSIVFEVNNLPASAVSYEIVRVKREDYDKSILMQGFLQPVRNPVGTTRYVANHEPYEISDFSGSTQLMNFISPEINFYKNFSWNGRVKIEASMYHIDDNVSADVKYHKATTMAPAALVYPPDSSTIMNLEFVDSRVLSPGYETIFIINNKDYKNYRYIQPGTGDTDRAGYMCTNLVIGVNSMNVNGNLFTKGLSVTAAFALANINRELSAQYGGASYSARLGNTYQSCYQETVGNKTTVYGGDTFICTFESMYGITDLTLNETYNTQHHLLFPVETSINLALRHDVTFMKTTQVTNAHLMQEFAGKHHDTVNNVDYTQETDLYLYNQVYSRESSTVTYFSKPLNFSNNRTFDGRILSSGLKKTNEEIDSWTSFLASNYVDVDGSYGPINKIVTFNQKLLFLQDKAIGWASVNERSLITPDATGATMSLGKGGILDQYFYISRHSGTKHQFSVVYTPNGVYYYDATNNRINVFTGEQNEPISEIKGIGSYLKALGPTGIKKYDKALSGIGVHGVYDQRFNRILWTFNDYGYADEFTISYNEFLQVFESFYSFKPRIYIKHNDYMYSPDPLDLSRVYLHNSGRYGEFYDSIFDSYIEILVNKDPNRSKAFTNLEYILNTSPEEAINFSTVRLYNNYQDSNIIPLTDSNSNRRNRVWRITAPRQYLSNDRIRGEYALINLSFDNSIQNVKFTLSDIITHYMSNSL